jgi:hypothetical protein
LLKVELLIDYVITKCLFYYGSYIYVVVYHSCYNHLKSKEESRQVCLRGNNRNKQTENVWAFYFYSRKHIAACENSRQVLLWLSKLSTRVSTLSAFRVLSLICTTHNHVHCTFISCICFYSSTAGGLKRSDLVCCVLPFHDFWNHIYIYIHKQTHKHTLIMISFTIWIYHKYLQLQNQVSVQRYLAM